jgi:hypothetical protein
MGPPSLVISGYRQIFHRGLNEMGSENEHSPPFRAELKMHGVMPLLPHYLPGVGRDSFTTTFSGGERMDGFRWCLANEERGIRHISDNIFIRTVI